MTHKHSDQEISYLREFQHFLDSTIHNLRASLREIGISTALLRERLKDQVAGDADTQLSGILNGVTKLDNLAKSLADYSMALISEGSPAIALPIERAVRAAIDSLKREMSESKASVHVDVLPELLAHHEQLSVLFRCLISNALEYRGSETPHIEIGATRTGDEWQFVCKSNGIGIAPKYRQQVFEPFQRLQSGSRGVGLGLTICKKIVEAHGGRIWLESEEGQETTVYFTLPANGDEHD